MKKVFLSFFFLAFSANIFAASDIQKIDQQLTQFSWYKQLRAREAGPNLSYNSRYFVAKFLHKKKMHISPETQYCSYKDMPESTCYIGQVHQNKELLKVLGRKDVREALKGAKITDF